MIKFLDILKESDDNIFIPRGSKEEKDKVLIRKEYDKIQEYIRNGSEGDLILMYSQIEKLPDNFTVNGTLDLQRCKNLQSLPNGLKVKFTLDLRGTNITSLPSDLEVGDNLILYYTPIADMYTIEQIREIVPNVKGSIFLHL